MKRNLLPMLMCLVMAMFFTNAFSQNNESNKNTSTIIIVRHAEKEAGNDPALTAAGMARAEKLSALFRDLKPDEIYTTPYVRTRQTITPWAKQIGIEMKEYNPANLVDLTEYLKGLKGKTVLVAGHSNTNPGLVNLLIDEQKFKNLDETDYETIYIVTINNGVGKAKVMKSAGQ